MKTRLVTDQLNRIIEIPEKPLRIISLVPSQTELLFDLGLYDEVVGITKFCIHPEDKVKTRVKIGGTKALNIEKIRALKPDLIIGNKEENEKEQIEEVVKEFNVWMSDIYTVEDALEMIRSIGKIVGKEQRAESIARNISKEFSKLTSLGKRPDPMLHALCSLPKIAYFIWKAPYMVAGANTFINHILEIGGWRNAFTTERYPVISPEELKKADPDIIFLSSEPYPFKEKHAEEFKKICHGIPVIIVDGELFSWYGSRLHYTPEYLNLLQKQLVGLKDSSKSD